jgi:hypothetical protein
MVGGKAKEGMIPRGPRAGKSRVEQSRQNEQRWCKEPERAGCSCSMKRQEVVRGETGGGEIEAWHTLKSLGFILTATRSF